MIPLLTKCKYNDPPPIRGNHKKFNLTPLPYTHTHILHYIVKMHYFVFIFLYIRLYVYPHAFLKKKRWGYCSRLRQSLCPSVNLHVFPPKPLDEIQPKLVCVCVCVCVCMCVSVYVCVCVAHINGVCNGTIFLAPPPGALGSGQTVEYYQIS